MKPPKHSSFRDHVQDRVDETLKKSPIMSRHALVEELQNQISTERAFYFTSECGITTNKVDI